MLDHGLGITNMIARATPTAEELERHEYVAGRKQLERKVKRHAPTWLAVVGIGAYRIAFGEPKAGIGRQERTIGATGIWVLPNPSGLNAHHQPADLARAFADLRRAVDR